MKSLIIDSSTNTNNNTIPIKVVTLPVVSINNNYNNQKNVSDPVVQHQQQQQQQQQHHYRLPAIPALRNTIVFGLFLVLSLLLHTSNSVAFGSILFNSNNKHQNNNQNQNQFNINSIIGKSLSSLPIHGNRNRYSVVTASSNDINNNIVAIISQSIRGGSTSDNNNTNNNRSENTISSDDNPSTTTGSNNDDNTSFSTSIATSDTNNNINQTNKTILQQEPATSTTSTTMALSTNTTDNATTNKNNDLTKTTTPTVPSTTGTPNYTVLQKVRRVIFPIYGQQEVRKFLLIGSIKFFIILALTLTRDCKDTLIVTQSGAEAIAFLKIYGVLPAATIYITLYSKLSDIITNKSTLFYITCIPFFIFFIVFDLLLYPNAHILHPSLVTVQKLLPGSSIVGSGMGIMANILSHWTSALFYIVSEIYSSVSVGLLFWQYANDVVTVDQAKRFYPLFAQMSGIAPVIAGQYVVHYASTALNFQHSLRRLTNAVTFAGIMICYFYYASNQFLTKTENRSSATGSTTATTGTTTGSDTSGIKKKKKKAKMTMVESAKFLANSQYLRLVATLVIGYGLSINFTEILWKSLVKKQYPDPLQYQRYMGQFSSIVGISTCIVIFFGVHVIRILGWRIGAMATPVVMASVSVPFFICVLWPGGGSIESSPTRLATAVFFGTLNSLLSKTAKYALFDPTTQMAYIPLDDDSKIKGKAAIDVLGSRIGKSGGSFIQQGLVIIAGTILKASPAVCVLYYGVLFTWMNAAHKLSSLFAAQTELHSKIIQQQQQYEQEQEDDNSTTQTNSNNNNTDLTVTEEIPTEVKKIQ